MIGQLRHGPVVKAFVHKGGRLHADRLGGILYRKLDRLALTEGVAGLDPDLTACGIGGIVDAVVDIDVRPLAIGEGIGGREHVLQRIGGGVQEQVIVLDTDHRRGGGDLADPVIQIVEPLGHVVEDRKSQLLTGLEVAAVVESQALLDLFLPTERVIETANQQGGGHDGLHVHGGTLKAGHSLIGLGQVVPLGAVRAPAAVQGDPARHHLGLSVRADGVEGAVEALFVRKLHGIPE